MCSILVCVCVWFPVIVHVVIIYTENVILVLIHSSFTAIDTFPRTKLNQEVIVFPGLGDAVVAPKLPLYFMGVTYIPNVSIFLEYKPL